MKNFTADMEVIAMGLLKEVNLMEEIKDEVDSYSDDSLYNITSFGTDLSFREIVTMYKEGDLEKPELQRKYVWTKNEASRFVDSILLGLPVPSIFLAKNKEGKRLIVDGYQRIMTIYDYMEGIFSGDNKVFKLSNSENINQRWRGKAYSELTDEQRRIIRTSPIHAIIFEQKQPQDDTGMYQIFERINTSGRVLKPQEIRNCVYHGKFNKFLIELNKLPIWRKVLKSDVEDSRMADIELILRFFAFSEIRTRKELEQNQINLVKFLNSYMSDKSDIDDSDCERFAYQFEEVLTFLYQEIGDNVFRSAKKKESELVFAKKVNPVFFDAICTATIYAFDTIGKEKLETSNFKEKYLTLLSDSSFLQATKQRTTNIDNIKLRINKACEYLYGVEYEW